MSSWAHEKGASQDVEQLWEDAGSASMSRCWWIAATKAEMSGLCFENLEAAEVEKNRVFRPF